MPILKIYNEDKELILVSQEFQGYKGWGLLTDLLPNTTYEEGTYFVSWEDKDFESEKIPVPRFTTESNTNKELVFYFKDALTVEPMTAYDIAVRNGFTGTELEWVKSIKGEKGDPGINVLEGGSAYDYWLSQGHEGTINDFLEYYRGNKGQKGDPFIYSDFTPQQLNELRVYISPGETHVENVDKDITDSLIVYPPNKEDFRTYPGTIDKKYFNTATTRNMIPENSINSDSSFTIKPEGWMFYTINAVDLVSPGNNVSMKIQIGEVDTDIAFQYAIQDASGEYITYITSLDKLGDGTYGLDNITIPSNASTLSIRVDSRGCTVDSEIKNFAIFDGGLTKTVQVSDYDDALKGIISDLDELKLNKDTEIALTEIREEIVSIKNTVGNTDINELINNKLQKVKDNYLKEFHIPVITPSKFKLQEHILDGKLFSNGRGQFHVDIDMNEFKVIGGKEYYLDTTVGNDSNDGLSKDTALGTLRYAINKLEDGDTLYIPDGDYFRTNGTLIPPTSKSINLIGLGDNVNLYMADKPLWIKTQGQDKVYQFTRSAVRRVIDVNNDFHYTNVNSISEVEDNIYSWYSDGTIVYINSNGIPNKTIVPFLSSQNIIVTNLTGNFYMENLNVYGGARPARFELTSNNNLYINNCILNYASQTNGNGLEVVGGNNVVVNNTTANRNWMDGFNYHVGSDKSLPNIVEINCTAMNNGFEEGTAGTKSNNGTTIHDGIKAIRVNGVYGRNDGGNVADVNENTESWNLDCLAFESYQGKDFQTSSGSNMWLDNCIAYGSENSINSADTNSTIYTRMGSYQNKLIIGEEIKY